MKQVLTPEQMQPIIEAGIDVSKASMWYGYYDYSDCSNPEWSNRPLEYFLVVDKTQFNMSRFGHECKFIPTFDLSNILDLLPEYCGFSRLKIERINKHYCISYRFDARQSIYKEIVIWSDCILDAAYKVLLWCIKNGHLKTK